MPEKIFMPARHGIGDALAAYFSHYNYGCKNEKARVLPRIKFAVEMGLVDSALILYEWHYSAFLGELFQRVPYIMPKCTNHFRGEVEESAPNNSFPDVVQGHRNILTNPPEWWNTLPEFAPLEIPNQKPCFQGIPSRYVLFSDGAGEVDRIITGLPIIEWIKEVERIPVIRIGQDHRGGMGWISGADLDFSNRSHIVESMWLAKHAAVIVSPITMWRVMASCYGTPVIELAQEGRVADSTISRTTSEYRGACYGMTTQLNSWFLIPKEKDLFQDRLRKHLDERK